jgi:hypothetical protein
VVGTILVAAALVAIGWWFGARQRVLNELFTVTVVDKQITEAVTTSLLLNNIDSGALDDARSTLKLQLDGNILFIDLLLPDCDERTRDLAQKVFARIGQYRAEHPATYSGKFPAQDAAVEAKINSILDRARKQQHK